MRPYSNLSNLVIWDYYLVDSLSYGSPYDLEVVEREMSLSEEQQLLDQPPQQLQPQEEEHTSRTLNACYDDVHLLLPDACTHLLQVWRREI